MVFLRQFFFVNNFFEGGIPNYFQPNTQKMFFLSLSVSSNWLWVTFNTCFLLKILYRWVFLVIVLCSFYFGFVLGVFKFPFKWIFNLFTRKFFSIEGLTFQDYWLRQVLIVNGVEGFCVILWIWIFRDFCEIFRQLVDINRKSST